MELMMHKRTRIQWRPLHHLCHCNLVRETKDVELLWYQFWLLRILPKCHVCDNTHICPPPLLLLQHVLRWVLQSMDSTSFVMRTMSENTSMLGVVSTRSQSLLVKLFCFVKQVSNPKSIHSLNLFQYLNKKTLYSCWPCTRYGVFIYLSSNI